MNIVRKLTLRHLLMNKRRTLVTIIGIIISVAMITAVATFFTSFVDMMKRAEISQDGEWHTRYKEVNKEDIEVIENHKNTKEIILSNDIGYSILEGGINEYKPYLYIKAYNENGFEKFPIKLVEGRLPENRNEILIPEHVEANGGVTYHIGDIIELQIGERQYTKTMEGEDSDEPMTVTERLDQGYSYMEDEVFIPNRILQYEVVGIIERPTFEYSWSPGYTALTYINNELIESDETVNVSVIVNKINKKIFKETQKLAKSLDVQYSTNSSLLVYYGAIANDNAFKGILVTMLILILIIMVGSISLIYNAFSISLSERSRYLGMLASVGATKKQKRSSVYFEGIAVGLVSIPIGILAGTIGMGITFMFVNPLLRSVINVGLDLELVVSKISILVAVVFSSLTIYLSSYIPARRASRISPIDAIRQTQDVKLTTKKVRTSKLTRLLFGFEAEIGLKNLKRNKGRYRTTIVSIVISILLFLTVSTFTKYMTDAYKMTEPAINYDLAIWLYDQPAETSTVVDKIKLLEGYDKILSQDTSHHGLRVDGKYVNDKGLLESDGKAMIYGEFIALPEEDLRQYSEELGVDYKDLIDVTNLKVIALNTLNYQDENGKYIQSEILNISTKEELPFDAISYNYETGEDTFVESRINFAAITKKVPMGVLLAGNVNDIKFITSIEVLSQFITNTYSELGDKALSYELNKVQKLIYMDASDAMSLENEIREILDNDNLNYYINNVERGRQEQKNMLLFVSVFVYGFITLITLICIANTINTISTSISLRKREFAMLKSVGMTPKAFSKMINYESLFYGMKALFYGLPLSFLVMYLMHTSLSEGFDMPFAVPWGSVAISVIGVFVIVGITMLYSTARIRKENIIDTLKQENI